METKILFSRATTAEAWGAGIFWAVTLLSGITLLAPQRTVAEIINPLLVTASVAGLAASLLAQMRQNDGNQMLRNTQLTDALAVPVGTTATQGYYNNLLPPSVDRLAATTFENTFFSSAVLQ